MKNPISLSRERGRGVKGGWSGSAHWQTHRERRTYGRILRDASPTRRKDAASSLSKAVWPHGEDMKRQKTRTHKLREEILVEKEK